MIMSSLIQCWRELCERRLKMCPQCSRKRYKEQIIKRGKRNFLIRVCLGCDTQYSLIEVHNSKAIYAWVEKDVKEDK